MRSVVVALFARVNVGGDADYYLTADLREGAGHG